MNHYQWRIFLILDRMSRKGSGEMPSLKAQIIAESRRIGIDKIGFTTAEPFYELKEPLERQRALGHNSGFEHQNIPERIKPELTFEKPQSIIAIALAYPTQIREEIPKDEKRERGMFARASWGVDYHDILQEKMQQLVAFIQSLQPPEAEAWRFAPQVDTGEFVDVAVAQRAGLGFVGRNGLLITEEFGSFVYLGEIVTNIAFEPDEPGVFSCGECTRCIKGCPTKALLGDGSMNAKRCLSYQTQTKGAMPKEYRKKIRNVIYGCDICQLVCPYNKGKDFHFHEQMEPKIDEVYPKLRPLLTISNKDFQRQFGHLAGSWRGKKPLQRNAIVALANMKDTDSLPLLWKLVQNDPRPVIRATAVWSISRLGKKEADLWQERLIDQQTKESDEEVLAEIQEALLLFANS